MNDENNLIHSNDPEDAREQAFVALRKQADLGSAESQRIVANLYLKGIGTKKSEEKYKYYLGLSVKQDDVLACFAIAENYADGVNGFPKSYEKAIGIYKRFSPEYGKASSRLGYFYENGLGVIQDKVKAFAFYKMAADKEDCFSCGKVALWMMESRCRGDQIEKYLSICANVKKEKFEALEDLDNGIYLPEYHELFEELFIYRFAKAYFGDADAMYQVAKHYAEGRGVEQSEIKTAEYYFKAAKAGNHSAKEKVQDIFEHEGSCKTFNRIPPESLSEQQRSVFCLPPYPKEMSDLCKQGRDYYLKKDRKANECYLQAIEQGDFLGSFLLAESYRKGFEVPLSHTKARELYKVAADAGISYAKYELARMWLMDSKYLDEHLIRKYLKSAAEQGILAAELALAKCYDHGIFHEVSCEKAFQHYYAAAIAGDHEAQYELARLYGLGRGVKRSAENAFLYLSKSAALDNPKAHYALGLCFEYGFGTNIDLQKAVLHYCRACFYDCTDAYFELGRLYQKEKWENAEFFIPYFYFQGANYRDTRAMTVLGHLYELGYLVQPSNQKAFRYYLSAAKKGYLPAFYEVGRCYKEGIGVIPSTSEALSYFKVAINVADDNMRFKAIRGIESITGRPFEKTNALHEQKNNQHTSEEQFCNLITHEYSRATEQKL